MKRKQLVRVSLLAILTGGILHSQRVNAEDSLETIEVNDQAEKQLMEVKKTRHSIQQEMIADTKDLVRYMTDVGIVDAGRHSKGFAIRGVESNRVGISIDGVNLPDSEENTLYGRYGNFNPARLNIDPELVQGIDITRGSASFESGSGALGGQVNYRTLEAYDIVREGSRFGAYLRGAYASKNSEWIRTAGIGYTGDKFDAVLLYSQRTGHELKSNGHGEFTHYSKSQHPDPATHRYHSYLAKLSYQVTPNHRIGFSVNNQQGNNYTDERSYVLYGSAWREADDEHNRTNGNIYYLYTPESNYLAFLKFGFDYQKTDLSAINYKGARNRRTEEKELDEILDRRMKTKFKRITLNTESQPLRFFGEHIVSLNTFASERNFENINVDRIGIGQSYEQEIRYTIQRPIKTRQYSVSVKDNIRWQADFENLQPVFTAQFGLRYDRIILTPEAFNAQCSTACLAENDPTKTTFNNLTYSALLNAQLNETWKFGYQLSSGFRVPTASEMFFSYKNAYGTWKANPNLRPERSLSHTFSLQAQNRLGVLDINLYHTRYKDFLLEQENIIKEKSYGKIFLTPVQQMVNINRAHISGIEVNGQLNLNAYSDRLKGWQLTGSLGYSKGKLSNQESLLSIQPLKAVLGLNYEHAEKKWGIFSRISYFAGKKGKDARQAENRRRCIREEYDAWYGHTNCVEFEPYKEIVTYKYLNKSAYVADLFGYYRPTQDITLRAGVYNLFNREYHTWDALRGINAHSTTNSVDSAGYGLERFKAPGRNYSAAVEIRF